MLFFWRILRICFAQKHPEINSLNNSVQQRYSRKLELHGSRQTFLLCLVLALQSLLKFEVRVLNNEPQVKTLHSRKFASVERMWNSCPSENSSILFFKVALQWKPGQRYCTCKLIQLDLFVFMLRIQTIVSTRCTRPAIDGWNEDQYSRLLHSHSRHIMLWRCIDRYSR